MPKEMAGRSRSARLAMTALALVTLTLTVAGCSGSSAKKNASVQPSASATAVKPAATDPPAEKPRYSKWLVHINDDASASQGGMTYSIALNLKATNTSGSPSGKYTGSATAKTSVTGSIAGRPLSASATANSSHLDFTLKATNARGTTASDVDAAGGTLASLVSTDTTYSGSGTITMRASGSAHVGQTFGPFSNTSSQKIELEGSGSNITLSVNIGGHTYKFKGTIAGKV